MNWACLRFYDKGFNRGNITKKSSISIPAREEYTFAMIFFWEKGLHIYCSNCINNYAMKIQVNSKFLILPLGLFFSMLLTITLSFQQEGVRRDCLFYVRRNFLFVSLF